VRPVRFKRRYGNYARQETIKTFYRMLAYTESLIRTEMLAPDSHSESFVATKYQLFLLSYCAISSTEARRVKTFYFDDVLRVPMGTLKIVPLTHILVKCLFFLSSLFLFFFLFTNEDKDNNFLSCCLSYKEGNVIIVVV